MQRFVEKPSPGEPDSNFINAGTYVIEPTRARSDPGPDAGVGRARRSSRRSSARATCSRIATDDYWLDAGRPEQYLQANLDLITGARGRPGNGLHADADVHPDAVVVESVIGPGAVVGAGARVTESVLLAGAVVGEGSVVERSVIAGHIGVGCVVTDGIVGAGYTVRRGTTVDRQRLPDPG